jgi:chaperone BCS1
MDQQLIEKSTNEKKKYKIFGHTFKSSMLFYGDPGCGKTSTIKAILDFTKRNGIMVNLNRIKTGKELEDIFRENKLNHIEYNANQLCIIIEDIDAFENDIVLARDEKEEIKEKVEVKKEKEDKLCLSTFLNILDGIIGLDGLMYIATTNHIGKLDKALLREGRFDCKIEFKRATLASIKKMIYLKYPNAECGKKLDSIHDYCLSLAQVENIIFTSNSIKECVELLYEAFLTTTVIT